MAGAGGGNSKATVRFKGDLRSVTILRNLDTVSTYMGGTQPMRSYVNDQWVDMRDVANTGFYLLPVTVFEPGEDGAPPVITLVIQDLKNPDDPSCGMLNPVLVAAIWNQFEGYIASQSGGAFRRSDATRKRDDANEIQALFCRESIPVPEAKPFQR